MKPLVIAGSWTAIAVLLAALWSRLRRFEKERDRRMAHEQGGVTHIDADDSLIGSSMDAYEWGLGDSLVLDAGKVWTSNPLDYWYWRLVQCQGEFYIGLPGLEETVRKIDADTRHDPATLDRALIGMVVDFRM